jgi:uncharacterized protein (TIGR02099 family)
MPVAHETAPATSAPRSLAARFAGFAGVAVAALVALACVVLLAVRYVVLPRVEAWRPEIAERLTGALGAPVAIEGLATGWDGWNPKVIVTGLTVRDRDPARERPLLELPRVEATISWWSLPLVDLRMKELAIEGPSLALSRDKAGRIHVAGLEIDPESVGDDTRLVDWILRQREIVVRDALILWTDERRRAPQLVLDQVQFRLEHPIGTRRHRFGLTGVPPSEIASPIDLRGEFTDLAGRDFATMRARMYLRLDFADIAAWSEWIPLPVEVGDGRGAVRMWAELAEGKVRDMTADVELADVSTRLGSLPPLELASVRGRVTWQSDQATRRFTADDLALVGRNGAALAPVDAVYEAVVGEDGTVRSGRASANVIELAPLASLAASLPMPATWREALARYAPRGMLRDARYRWEGPPDAPTSYVAEVEAVDVGVAASGATPGVTGLSAKVQADERGGSAKLGSRAMVVSLPRTLTAPVPIETLTGTVRWRLSDAGNEVVLDDVAFTNADAAVTANGTWRPATTGAGTVDLKAQVARIDVRRLARYLPRVLDEWIGDWMRGALQAGTMSDARLVVKGDLARFPFADPKQGTFTLAARAQGATLDYAAGWPAVSDIDGEVRFDGAKVAFDMTKGRVYGAQIGRTKIAIDDLLASVTRIRVDGEATGPTAEFLHFIETSPVAGWIGGALGGAQATGNGTLKMRFELPLGVSGASTVAGEYAFASNQLRVPGVPVLSQVDGRMAFSENSVTARDLSAEVYGGPATFSMSTADGGFRATAQGTASLLALRNDLPDAFSDRVSGTTDWSLALESHASGTRWTVESSLRGATIDLPAPAGKVAADSVPLRIERRPDARGATDAITIDAARVGRVLVQRRLAGATPVVDRVLVLVGRAASQPADNDRAGVWIRGDLAALDVDDWLAVKSKAQARSVSAAPSAGLSIRGVDLDAAVLGVFGRKLNDVKVSARSTGDDWRLQLAAREAAGTADWRAATPAMPSGRIVARLTRLAVPEAGELSPPQGAEPRAGTHTDGGANPWPELDVQSAALISKGRDLGRFEMVAKPQATDWRIEKLVLSSDAGRVNADGWWRAAGRTQQTRLDVSLETQEAGAMLKRFGFDDVMRGAPTTIKGQLDWPGAPSDYDPTTLSGALKVEVGSGQFTKIEPGIGKLLGVLSLQALPRRIALDFRDVFSEGFAFDRIDGNVRIARGVMTTDDLRLVGPAARVDITGEANLARETQNLAVRVLPALSTTLSTGAAGAALLLLAANPLVAAAVGAGTLLAQKVMKDPLEQMFAYDYRVTGSWSDPVVERVGSRPVGEAAVAATVTPPAAVPAPAPTPAVPAAPAPSGGAPK